MSFAKARDMMQLALFVASERTGVTLEQVAAKFERSHRTAQRMMGQFEITFDNAEVIIGEDRKKRWKLVDPQLDRLQVDTDTALEALEIAMRAASHDGRRRHAKALEDLRNGLVARLPRHSALRAEADAEAILSALALVSRPGPRVVLPAPVTEAVVEALRGPFQLRVIYGKDARERTLEPHGVLMGHRSYLVARDPAKGDLIRNYRMDLITEAAVLDQSFALAEGFSMPAYAAQSFGVWQDPKQFGEVVWQFTPEAAGRAAEFCFHPNQQLEPQSDGSLIVRFEAAGWQEMAWHLYQWGDKVTVLAPDELRAMVEGHQRDDFTSMP
ncbi:DeoR family transcriptional regulator [Thioclava sediminum]|uniref:DeoR family transcriptional regulator n=1 Tax=Thioclava sediminum TaxID=1915319 RepID=A0ABX3N208_9RHOB|nr:WYL domain-containing protein [Thioclava sediminum]OOY24905.1 DeoR family transcriptional regulator [Thioclava sediminum]